MNRTRITLFVGLLVCTGHLGVGLLGAMDFIRGDSNRDGVRNIADPIHTINFLFVAGTAPHCLDSADINDDGFVDLADVVYQLSFIGILTAAPISFPEPNSCGIDPSADSLDCVSYSPCP